MNNRIIVVGTCHGNTLGFKVDDLYQLLCSLKPDIILNESAIDENIDILDWLKACANYYKKQGGGESSAILRYLEDHPAEVLPYDIKGRNEYFAKKKYFEHEQAYNKAYADYFKQPTAHPTAVYLDKLITNMQKKLSIGVIKDRHTLADINSLQCDVEVETYISVLKQVNRAIFNLVPEFAKYQKDFWGMLSFHARRDKAMVQNILAYNRQYDNKTIVVLCGYFHRYALIKLLKSKHAKEGQSS
jgi:hypothetical protein